MNLPVLIIVNPKAGTFNKERLQLAVDTFRAGGFVVEVYYTAKTGDAETRTRQAVNESFSMVVSVGGDGTINEVANGAAFSAMPVGVLPFGTSSVLCNDLGLKGDVVTAVRRLISGKPYDVSMGRIKTPWGQRYFIEMAGAGLDAAAVYGLNRRIKVYAGVGAYILSGINCIVNESFQRMTVSVNGSVIACNTVILSNGACYGGNIRMAPQADIRQPSLYATVFRYGHRLEMFAAVADVFRGRHASGKSKYVEHIEFREMAIETDSFHIHVDGDYFSRTPAEVDIVERALRLVY